jgi:hypothetical protein
LDELGFAEADAHTLRWASEFSQREYCHLSLQRAFPTIVGGENRIVFLGNCGFIGGINC